MVFLILPNEEVAVARSGAGWFEDMQDKNQDKRLWQALVGNDGRTALLITPGTGGLLTQQETAALVPELDPMNWPSSPSGGEGEV
jgi:hypothetical protein